MFHALMSSAETRCAPALRLLLAGLGLGAGFAALLWAVGLSPSAAFRDAGTSDLPGAGLVSTAGVLAMGAAGFYALLRGILMRRMGVFVLGLFCLVFAIDDGLMLHEELGNLEIVVYLAYAGLLGAAWALLARESGRQIVWPLVMAFAAFVASAVVDIVWAPILKRLHLAEPLFSQAWDAGYIVEDAPKLAGLLVMCSLCLGEALKHPDPGRADADPIPVK